MPFIGEQPAETAILKIIGRAATITLELSEGTTLIVTTRSGTVSVGVE